jgi:cytochrome d ubiquinol oxidase subunit II
VFAAWPLLYAASFSGLYLAMFLVLVALILRPVGFTFRDKLAEPRWRSAWDWALTLGGAVPALLFGVAFGNLFLGLPFHYDELQRPVFSGSFFALLHPFALLVGIVSLAMLILHGNTYAALRVGEPMARRAANLGRAAAVVFVIAFILAGVWVGRLEGARIVAGADPLAPSNPLGKQVVLLAGGWLANYRAHSWLWLLPAAGVLGAAASWMWLGAQRPGRAFLASCVSVTATILTAGVGLFPFLMPSSTHPSHGLTVWDASSSALTLGVMLLAVVILLPVVLAYTVWVFHVLRGKVTLDEIRRHTGLY